jgi:MOSC domain-containing protein YiiM
LKNDASGLPAEPNIRHIRKEGKLMATATGRVLSVNVGGARTFNYNGRAARSAIWKSPVFGRIAAKGVNLAGDDQADRKAHGGPDKVVYAYAIEDVRWWEERIGRTLAYGELGENLSIERIMVNDALVGERWQIGTLVLEVSEPRIPCWRLGVRMNDKTFPRTFTQALRPGAYFRLIVEGEVGAGDEIQVIERPDHDVTIREVFRIYTSDHEEAERLLAVPRMSESWKRWARDLLQLTKDHPANEAGPGCC